MLLEVAFVQAPEFNAPAPGQAVEFFKRRDLDRVGLGDLGSGLAQPESHVAEDSLALAHAQLHPVVQAQMRREQLAVPQMTGMTELLWLASHVTP